MYLLHLVRLYEIGESFLEEVELELCPSLWVEEGMGQS